MIELLATIAFAVAAGVGFLGFAVVRFMVLMINIAYERAVDRITRG